MPVYTYHTFCKAPPRDGCSTMTKKEEEDDDDNNNHPVQKYVVVAHVCGVTFSLWIFHQAKNNNF